MVVIEIFQRAGQARAAGRHPETFTNELMGGGAQGSL
jgi:hypothetical protein